MKIPGRNFATPRVIIGIYYRGSFLHFIIRFWREFNIIPPSIYGKLNWKFCRDISPVRSFRGGRIIRTLNLNFSLVYSNSI